MPKTVIGIITVVILACLGLPTLLLSSVMGAGSGGCGNATTPAAHSSGQPSAASNWDTEQLDIAGTILDVGVAKAVPRWGWVVGIATAMQESGLRNLPHLGNRNDHDSIGVFQQRPSQGWGTVEQLSRPAYQAGKFFDKLLTVPDWQSMPLTQAAQTVQASAFPDAYAKWSDDALNLVEHVISANLQAIPEDLEQCVSIVGWTQPVHAPIVSGFRTNERPGHDGVDLGAPGGTAIRAAAAGQVVTARCDTDPSGRLCDRRGSKSTPGCGWYVKVRHANDIVTMYCHMIRAPIVHVGQTVSVGQEIGQVGSSGHSSGEHLHFEVQAPGRGPVDPVPFMRGRGAALGM